MGALLGQQHRLVLELVRQLQGLQDWCSRALSRVVKNLNRAVISKSFSRVQCLVLDIVRKLLEPAEAWFISTG